MPYRHDKAHRREFNVEEKLRKELEESLNEHLLDIILSNPPSNYEVSKIKIRPIIIKEELIFQVSEYKGNQIFHTNYKREEVISQCEEWFSDCMKQVLIKTRTGESHILISKKGKVTIKKKGVEKSKENQPYNLSHNREKTYIIPEGVPVPFLIDLGVMTKEGMIVKAKYDKFRQINRFLEFIQDILPSLKKDKKNTILDFGCGKSYLTFAMYYYLKVMNGYDITIIGLDLKKDVIKKCNELAKSYGYEELAFLEGDIASYKGVTSVDMVVTLHACDTATDYALYKAVQWGAKVILSVPCCQHELNKQIQNEVLNPILQYGLLKERMAALLTDGIRAVLLESAGYKAQILEFIDMEHTPKNILIRATLSNTPLKENQRQEKLREYKEMVGFLQVKPTLYSLLYTDK